MRKLAVAVALASTALASPAMARDNSWYVGVGGGVMLVEDMDLDIGTVDNAGTLGASRLQPNDVVDALTSISVRQRLSAVNVI